MSETEAEKTIGGYLLKQRLGGGSFGEVWLAKDPEQDQEVALKILRWEQMKPAEAEKFKREFEILKDLHHTNLARVFHFGYASHEKQYYFTSEYCPGRPFAQAIAGKSHAFFEAALVQVLSALDHIHSQGIIHFDIKSSNILVAEEEGLPRVKVLDFGISTGSLNVPRQLLGTLAYMAPEILLRSGFNQPRSGVEGEAPRALPVEGATRAPVIDHRADLYSLGMLCLMTLNGSWPFDIKNKAAIMEWHLRGSLNDVPWQENIPRHLRELILKLLEKRPADRFSHARVVLNFLNLASNQKYKNEEQKLTARIPVEGPCVGRHEILEKTRQALSQAHPDTRSFRLVGERGSGKTRILKEIRYLVELTDLCLCEWRGESSSSLWSHLVQHLGLSQEMAGNFPTPDPLNQSTVDPQMMVRIRADQIFEQARQKPSCLLIDDLDKADPLSQSLMTILRHRLKTEPCPLLLVTAEGGVEGSDGEMILRRLTSAEVLQYVHCLLGDSEESGSVGNLLFDYSGGLPILVAEGLKYLAPFYFRGEPLEDRLPPPRMHFLYQEKLKALKAEECRVLHLLVLMGRPTSQEEISPILHISSSLVDSLMRTLLQTGLVSRQENHYQIFSQALALDLVELLEPDERQKLHLQIGLTLEKSPSSHPREIADHLAKGGYSQQAVTFYEKASQDFLSRGDIAQAAQALDQALQQLLETDPVWEDIILRAVSLLIPSGDYDHAEKYLKRLQKKPSVRREELHGWLATKKRQFQAAKDHYLEALKALEPGDQIHQIRLRNALANMELQLGNVSEATRLFQESLDLEKGVSADENPGLASNHLGLALALSKDLKKAVHFYENRLKNILSNKPAEKMTLLNAQGYVLLQASHYAEASHHLQEALQLAESSGSFHALFSILGNLTTALLKETRYPEALSTLRKMAHYQKRFGTDRDMAFNFLRQGSVYLILGMEESAQSAFEHGLTIANRLEDRTLRAWFFLMEAYRLRDLGKLQEAKTRLQDSLSCVPGDPSITSWVHYSLADIAFELEDVSEAASHLGKIKNIEDEEFETRIKLLKTQLASQETNEESFSLLEKNCREGGFRELLWEVYLAWGHATWNHGEKTKAKDLWDKGLEVVEEIASTLPEEYRDRYRNHRQRSKLQKEKRGRTLMKQGEILEKLLKIDRKMVSEHNPQKLLEFILDAAVELAEADEGILLMKTSSGSLEPRVARNIQRENLETVAFSRSIAEQAIERGKPLLSLNAGEDFSAIESVARLDLKSVACLPMKIHTKVLGAIYLANQRVSHTLSQDYLSILQAFADQASIALENATLFQENEEYRKRLEDDLSETRHVLEEKEIHLHELETLIAQQPRQTLYAYDRIIGRSKKVEEVLKTLDKITNAQVPVFIFGETGTGKELLARALHQNSLRKTKSFVAINCSAFSETILESELFGYQKGAFTGADRDRKGLFEEADQGTLFLDEVADMSLSMQAKILRAIQEQEIMRVGGRHTIKIQVRLVSAANKDLKKLVREGKFREDLYFRLTGITIQVPALRERKEDLPLLITHILERVCAENNIQRKIKIHKDALTALTHYDWPGNIRELEQCLTSACLMSDGEWIRREHLLLQKDLYDPSARISKPSSDDISFNPEKKLDDYESEIIRKTLEFCAGNKSETARRLGLSRLTLHKRLQEKTTSS